MEYAFKKIELYYDYMCRLIYLKLKKKSTEFCIVFYAVGWLEKIGLNIQIIETKIASFSVFNL